MGSRSTRWPTSCSCKPPQASRAPSRLSARAPRTEGGEREAREERVIIGWRGVTCIFSKLFMCPLLTLKKTVLFWFRLGQMKRSFLFFFFFFPFECEREKKCTAMILKTNTHLVFRRSLPNSSVPKTEGKLRGSRTWRGGGGSVQSHCEHRGGSYVVGGWHQSTISVFVYLAQFGKGGGKTFCHSMPRLHR